MKYNLKSCILLLSIMVFVILIIGTISIIMHITVCNICNGRTDNYKPQNINKKDNELIRKMVSVANNNNNKTSEELGNLSNTNVIQRVLENTVKGNDDIALMAVYAENGTILAHLDPERIGKNMFDVEEELSFCLNEMYNAIKNRKIYNGFKYDPLLNEKIKFIVKPLQIGNFDQKLSLLIGVHKPK